MTSRLETRHPATGRLLDEADEVTNILDMLRGDLGYGNIVAAQAMDGFDRRSIISGNGETIGAAFKDDISVNFQYGVSTSDIKNGGDVTGGGSVGLVKSTATASIDTAVGSATLESVDAIRYVAGHEVIGVQSIIFAAPEAGVNQYAGFLNADDGWSVGYQGLNFGLWFIEGGNANFIDQADFNKDILDGSGASGVTLNPQALNLYRLSFTWHGGAALRLEVRKPITDSYVPVHIKTFLNVATETHLENPNLPLAVKIERASGSGLAATIKTGSWRGGIVDTDRDNTPSDRWFAFFNLNITVNSGANTGTHLMTLRSKTTYQSKTNHIKTLVKILSTLSSHTKDLVVAAIPTAILRANDAVFAAALDSAYFDTDTLNSVIEQAKLPLTVDMTGITEASYVDVGAIKRGGERTNTDVDGFNVYPGNELSFVVVPIGAGAGEVTLQGNFKELH